MNAPAKPNVFVYGPQGCGKTRNSAALAVHFARRIVIDGWEPRRPVPAGGCLILCVEDPRLSMPADRLGEAQVFTYQEAAAAAGIKPQQPAAKQPERHHAALELDLRGHPGEAGNKLWALLGPPVMVSAAHYTDTQARLIFWSGLLHGVMASLVEDVGPDAAMAMVQHFANDCGDMAGPTDRPAGHQVH